MKLRIRYSHLRIVWKKELRVASSLDESKRGVQTEKKLGNEGSARQKPQLG
jgi:hypothetical protein